jgi:hypothetical protein
VYLGLRDQDADGQSGGRAGPTQIPPDGGRFLVKPYPKD